MRSCIRVLKLVRWACLALLTAGRVGAQVDVLTERMDNTRSGMNLNETHLTKANVKNGTFGKLAFRIVNGNIYAQILLVSQAKITGRAAPVNVAIVATEHNSVYAFDADDVAQEPGGQESKKALWHTDKDILGEPIPYFELYGKINAPGCTDITTEVGITGTPHIVLTKKDSPKEGVIFVVAKSKTSDGKYSNRLFALSLADGKPVGDASGVEITGQVTGPTGAIAFDPVVQLNRPGLLVDNGTLYIAFGGHCDAGNYHGWVFAYDVTDPTAPKKVDVFASTFIDRGGETGLAGRGGIWMSGEGPNADGNGNIFFVTGDGSYDVSNASFRSLGNSVVKVKMVSGKIQVEDWYSPQNREDLRRLDADLGSGGAVLVPGSHLLLAGGKEGRMYLLDRDNLGRGTRASLHSFQVTNAPLAKVPNPTQLGSELFWNIHGAPVVWPLPGQMFVYVMGEEDHMKQYKLVPDGAGGWRFASDQPFKTSPVTAPLPNGPIRDKNRVHIEMPGGFITVSSNGSDPASGIVWATMPFAADANTQVSPGILRAFDASDVSQPQLWSTEESGVVADRIGMFAKFNPPTVGNGKVLVATFQEEALDAAKHRTALTGGVQPALAIYGIKH